MRSGTSYFNGTVFKKTVTRFWPLWAAYFVIWFISMPLSGLMQLSAQARSSIKDIGYMIRFAYRTVPGMCTSATWLAAVFGLLCAMAVCSHLYGARSANFFGSLPIRREGMFLTQYLAGLSFFIVPNLAIALLTLLVEAMGGAVCIQGLLFWLAVSSGSGFFFYSMAVFCGMFTGHILALPVFYGVANIIGYGIWVMCTGIGQMFFYGYVGGTGLGYRIAQWCTPAWKLDNEVWASYTSPNLTYDGPAMAPVGAEIQEKLTLEGLPEIGVYVLAAVVLTVCAFLLYRARRMESAGDVVSVNPMKPVFKYGVAICSGLTFGMGTRAVLYIQEFGLMAAIIIWGIVGYFAAQMLLDKSFRVFKKWKGAVAVTAVFAVLFVVVGFDLTGFETRMPDPDQVESVHVSGLNAVGLGDDADSAYAVLDDPRQIELVMDLHRAAIGQRNSYTISGGYVTDLRCSTSLNVSYYMKDGSRLARRYTVWLDPSEVDQGGSGAWAMQQLYNDRELYWDIYGFAEMDQLMAEEGWWMEQARYSDYSDKYDYSGEYYGEYYHYADTQDTDRYFYGKDAMALYDAVREDYEADRIGVRVLPGADEYDTYQQRERELHFVLVNGTGNERWVRIAVQDTASSTLAALEALADDAPLVDDDAAAAR